MWKVAAAAIIAALLVSRNSVAADADPWIGRDKALHFDVSAGVAAATYAASAGWLVHARGSALALGGGVALGAGAAKELLDMTGLGDPSWKDFAWDAIGVVAGLALAWSMDMLLGGVDGAHPALGAPSTELRPASLAVRFR